MMRQFPAAVVAVIAGAFTGAALLMPRPLRAINLEPSSYDLQRAVALARWPSTDADRSRFHQRYLIAVTAPPVDGWSVKRLEVITELRRAELMAEEHARLNDSWGRAGTREVEDALRPWKKRVAIVVHLTLESAGYAGAVPDLDIVIEGVRLKPLESHRTGVYGCDDAAGCALVGGIVESIFDAPSVGQSNRTVLAVWNQREMAKAAIDFANLD